MEAEAGAWSTVQNVDFHFISCFHPAPGSALTGARLEQFLLRKGSHFLGAAGVEKEEG